MLAVDAGTFLSGIYRSLCGKANIEETPFAGLQIPDSPGGFNPKQIAAYIFQRMIASVCITHPHLDHVSGFGINAALLKANSERTKVVAGLEGVVTALKTHIFNGIIWPNFTDEDGGLGLFRLKRLEEGSHIPPSQNDGDYAILSRGLSVKAFRLNHGSCLTGTHPSGNPERRIESTAFFVRDVMTRKEVIIFGDVEPDSLVLEQRNQQVWQAGAPKFVDGHLRAIFIECSYDDSVANDALYGHLCPRHLVDELGAFAQLVKRERVDRSNYLAPYSSLRSAKGKNKRSREDDPTGLERGTQKKAALPSREEDTVMTTPTEEAPIAEYKGGEDTMMPEPLMRDSTAEPMTEPMMTEPMTETVTKPFVEPSVEDQLAFAEMIADEAADEIMGQTMSALVPNPLEGLHVYLIHIKDDMQGPNPADRILNQVRSHVKEAGLGCIVDVVKAGQSIYF